MDFIPSTMDKQATTFKKIFPSGDVKDDKRILMRKSSQFDVRLRYYVLAFLFVLAVGSIGFAIIEGKSLLDAFYFTIVTMATVGYGDVTPATQAGKLFTILLIVTGVGTFLGLFVNAVELALKRREMVARLEKLNVLIGLFYSEIGHSLLATFSTYDPDFTEIRANASVEANWTDKDFSEAKHRLSEHNYRIDFQRVDLADLKVRLIKSREMMVRILENPILLDHEAFTDLLHAVFHLMEELHYRTDFDMLTKADQAHLAGDINRAFGILVGQWFDYMKYLKINYPYLFHLALRVNPFIKDASAVIAD